MLAAPSAGQAGGVAAGTGSMASATEGGEPQLSSVKPVKQGVMCKRAQGKSKFGRDNWKDRFFVLTPEELTYWEGFGGPTAPGAKLKGSLPLTKVVVVEAVPPDAFKPPRVNMLQITYVPPCGAGTALKLRMHLYPHSHLHARTSTLTHINWQYLTLTITLAPIPPSPESHTARSDGGRYDEATLYAQAQSPEEREGWLAEIRRQVKGNDGLQPKFHAGVFNDTKWTCCGSGRRSVGCAESFDYTVLGGVMKRSVSDALPPTPGSAAAAARHSSVSSLGSQQGAAGALGAVPASPQQTVAAPVEAPTAAGPVASGDEFEVIVMYGYQALEDSDLPLQQGERLVIMEQAEEHWWKARNGAGRVGMIPSNYVRKVGLESEP